MLQVPSVGEIFVESQSKDFDNNFRNIDIDQDVIDAVKNIQSIIIIHNCVDDQYNFDKIHYSQRKCEDFTSVE